MNKEATPAETQVAPEEELVFHPSPEPTLGVEMELQIIDRESGDLAPGAVRLLQICNEDKLAGVSAELMQSMLEVKTGVCANVSEVRSQLWPLLRRVRNLASSLGYELALGGTHPFHRTSTSTVYPAERYDRIVERLAWLTNQRVVFGLHVHVGVPGGDLAVGVINLLIKYLPHLLAVSANSPFWQGVDTGLASCRAALYGLLPHSGIPPHFGKWKDFRGYCQVMKDCQALRSFKDIYWDIRPRPDLGTIEFRVCDMPPRLELVLALVSLTHCLVIFALRLLQEKPHLQRGDLRRHWIAGENKWLATRYGLQALHIRTPAGKRRPLLHDLAEVLEKIIPIARETREEAFLAPLRPIDKFLPGSDWQRNFYRQHGNWKALVQEMARQFSEEIERGQ